ncbi:MAG TPA: hypothetical protein VLC93_19125 [Myxococcota bacterium]|nr:hypothetical protein [Myxococcota bacterium]
MNMRVSGQHPVASSSTDTRLKTLTPLTEWSAAQLTEMRSRLGLDGIQLPPVRTGIALYRVTYATPDIRGNATTASGLLMVPLEKKEPAPVLSYQHGTTAGRDAGPSRNLKASQHLMVAAVYGAAGYLWVLADYIGFGDSAEPNPEQYKDPSLVNVHGANHRRIMHPYCNAKTEASACADLLIAAGEAAEQLGVKLSGKLFLSGYSQGGQASMALHRHLETDSELKRRFKVTASAPIAGPHDIVRTVERLLERPNPIFGTATFAYGMMARDHVGKFWPKVTDFLVSPYAERAWTNFSEPPPGRDEYPWKDGFSGVDPKSILTPKVYADLFVDGRMRPDTEYAKACVASSAHLGWKSDTPILLISPREDDICPVDINGVDTERTMKANGFTQVGLLLVPGDHLTGARAAFAGAVACMEKLR